MKKFFPVFVIFIAVFIFFWQFFFKDLLPIPSDTLIGLYHPFRDLYSKNYPNGIPFKNFLITDPIRQQYPWRELSIYLEKKLQFPLWNPYSFSGYPLLANFQSGVFYPLNILFFILPFSTAWGLLIFLQTLLGGIFLFLYLRNLKLVSYASIIGGLVFALSGFSIAWLEWNTVFQTLIWLPLILLAKDKLTIKWTKKWMIIFIFAEVASFLAGHLQIWFYGICLTNLYLFLRIFQKTKLDKPKNFLFQYKKTYFPFFLVGLIIFILTSLQWVPTLQFILLSARSLDQSYLQAGWFIPYQHLVQFLIPDFFGNPTTLNYWGVWNYAEFVGYIGILPLIFSLFAILSRRDKKTFFWGIVCLLAIIFALPTPVSQLPYILRIPFLSTSQPTRLTGIVDLALAVLAALGIDHFIKTKSKSIFAIIGLFGALFTAIWLIVLKLYQNFGITLENSHTSRQNLLFPTIIFFICVILITSCILIKNKRIFLLLSYFVFIVICIDLIRFGWKFTPFTPNSYLYPPTKSLAYLQRNIGNYRFMTTDSRILAPNTSDIYRLQSIEGYDPLYLRNYGEFIAAMQRNKPDISSPFGFNRIITPHDYRSPLINLLGVKYILTFDKINSKNYKEVFQEGLTKVYENGNVIPRVFFAKQILAGVDRNDSINKIYSNIFNLSSMAIVQDVNNQADSVGLAQITSYSPNSIILLTKNNGTGFLVLTDIYYPSWHAYIDNKEVKIYPTDYAFRGVFVPTGLHRIEFKDQLF